MQNLTVLDRCMLHAPKLNDTEGAILSSVPSAKDVTHSSLSIIPLTKIRPRKGFLVVKSIIIESDVHETSEPIEDGTV